MSEQDFMPEPDPKDDLMQISHMINEYVDKKYIRTLKENIAMQKRKCMKSPSPEVNLLQAILPYLGEQQQKTCNEMIKTLTQLQVAQYMWQVQSRSLTRSENKEAQDKNQKQTPIGELQKLIIFAVMYRAINEVDV